jgi:type VI secretion system protein ImpM
VEVGLYGKLPSHGDFLRRRVADAFVGAWDAWLQQSIAASRAQLGEGWLDLYLTSPAWRFACAPGVLSADAITGVMVPSVDRVGRYFPLTIVCELANSAKLSSPLRIAIRCEPWFSLIEQLAIEALATERLEFDVFDSRVADSVHMLEPLAAPPAIVLAETDASALMEDARGGWHVPLASADSLTSITEQLVYARLRARADPVSLWWTEGSALVAPCCLLMQGLPHPDGFAAFLDGQWRRGEGWHTVSARIETPPDHDSMLASDDPLMTYVSAGHSECGPVRKSNQDAFMERPEAGVWVVADGMGGHERGELASRMVCDAVMDLAPEATLQGMADAVHRRLSEVNAHLHRQATQAVAPLRSGTTVVALITRGSHCQVLWAGDSRAYRLRAERLDPLTQDHVWQDAGSDPSTAESFVITRAVGGEPTLVLDVYQGGVRRGDRFLLCSDGLARVLDDATIARHLAALDPNAAVAALIGAALHAGTTDNITAVVVAA